VFTGVPRSFPAVGDMQEILTFGEVRVMKLAIYAPIIMLVLLFSLLFLINKTKTGMAMRASSKDFETARLMGINVNKTISMTFLIGSALAAVGAVIWGQRYPQIQPFVGVMPGLKCFIAAVIGGIGNIKGAVVGGMLLGVMEILIVWRFSALSGYKDAFAFIILIVILLFKPTGLFGETFVDKV